MAATTITMGPYSTTTDASGFYTLANVALGNYTLVARRNNDDGSYRMGTVPVTVDGSTLTITANVTMARKAV